jgi:SAM-dependent methyltransferase
MRFTPERHSPDAVDSVERAVIHALHEYPYRLLGGITRKTDRVLEVGSGEGYGAHLLRDSIAEYCGLEVAESAVAHASQRYDDPKLTFRLYGGGRFPFEDDSFDVVFSFQVIEHVEDMHAYLDEIRRTCRPGGTVVIVTPNRNHRLEPGERPWNRYHRIEFSPHDLRDLLQTYFGRVDLFGIHGTPLIQQIEKRRVARLRKIARLDPLGVRYVLPGGLMSSMVGVVRRLNGTRNATPDSIVNIDDISVRDISHSEEALPTSLDLLAVIRV